MFEGLLGRNIRYFLLAIMGFLFLVASIGSFVSYTELKTHSQEIKRTSSWIANQSQVWYVQFLRQLEVYSRTETEDDYQRLQQNFDLLLSRHATMSQGEEGHELRSVDGALDLIKDFGQALQQVEYYLYDDGISPDNMRVNIERVLSPFEYRLSRLSQEIILENPAQGFRDELFELERRIFLCLVGVMLSGLWLVLIFRAEEIKARRLQQEARRISERLMLALDAMTEGFAVFDEDGQLMLCNRRFRKLMQIDKELEKIDLTFEDILRSGMRRGVFSSPLRDADGFIHRQLELLEQEYSVHELELVSGSCYRVEGYQTENRQKVFIYVDITENRRREDELREALIDAESANRAKASFLANISHELRTPLNAIIGFSEIMESQLMGPLGSDHYLEYARDIVHSGKHLLKLINDILDLSKVQAGHLELDDDNVDPLDLINDCLPLVRMKIAEKRQQLDLKVPQQIYKMHVDHRRFKQVIINLVTNAMKFTSEEGNITIRLSYPEGGGLRLTIADNGIGIAPKDLKRVMQPFSQADNRLAREYEGTGLGLPLSRNLVEAHGGTLKIETEVNKGTEIHINLPEWRVMRQHPIHPFANYAAPAGVEALDVKEA